MITRWYDFLQLCMMSSGISLWVLPVRYGNANMILITNYENQLSLSYFWEEEYNLQSVLYVRVYVFRTITISWPLHQPTSPPPPHTPCWISLKFRGILRRAYIGTTSLPVSQSHEPQYKGVIIYIKVAKRRVSLGFMVKAMIHAWTQSITWKEKAFSLLQCFILSVLVLMRNFNLNKIIFIRM